MKRTSARLAAIAESGLGRWLDSIGARTTMSPSGPTNLTVGMLSVVPMMALGALFYLRGARHLPEDQERARQQGGSAPIDGPILH